VIPIVRSQRLVKAEEANMINNRYKRMRSRLLKLSAVFDKPFLERLVAAFSRRYAQLTTTRLKAYVIAPHILYETSQRSSIERGAELCIGSFGFAFRFKNFDKIIQLAKRLQIKAVIIATINSSSQQALEETSTVASELERSSTPDISVITNYLVGEEILTRLAKCTHLIFAQEDRNQTSGSIRFVSQLGLPVISTDCFQAREAGCLRVKSLSDITIKYLESTREAKCKIDDGLPYYQSILS
jgi:hypothetical protein